MAISQSKLLHNVASTLKKKRLTLSVCESCTGGMLSSIITSIPGSSKYFLGGIIAYSNEVKEKTVGVRTQILKRYGAVSGETAQAMAQAVQKKLKSDIGIAITGIAGPTGGSKKKPVGLAYIAFTYKNEFFVERFLFKGNRETIRKKACQKALLLLNSFLSKH